MRQGAQSKLDAISEYLDQDGGHNKGKRLYNTIIKTLASKVQGINLFFMAAKRGDELTRLPQDVLGIVKTNLGMS